MRTILPTLLLAPALAFAGPPDWVAEEGRSPAYPEAAYFTGFGQAMLGPEKDEARCSDLAFDGAKRALAQGLIVSVKSVGVTRQEQRGDAYSQDVVALTESVSSLDVAGLKRELYRDAKRKMCYCLALVKKRDLAKLYAAKKERLRGELDARMSQGRSLAAKGERAKALAEYLAAQRLLKELQEAESVLSLSGGGIEQAFAEAEGRAGEVSAQDLDRTIEGLAEKPVASLDDAAWALAFYLKKQAGLPEGGVLVQPFTFRDTRMGSPFARCFKQLLEGRLADTAGWTVVEQKAGAKAGYALAGTYWAEGGGLRLMAKLRRVSDGGLAAGTELSIPDAAVAAAKLDIRPENYRAALVDQGLFGADELRGGGLTVDVWTDKGAESPLFVQGDRLRVFVRMNLPGYLRLIDHLADGKRALLLDNYYIDESKVNAAYELPQEFEVSAPFGAETLQAFASTAKFEPLRTAGRDGYDILEEDLAQALVKTRGLKRAQAGPQKAESRIVLTTTAR